MRSNLQCHYCEIWRQNIHFPLHKTHSDLVQVTIFIPLDHNHKANAQAFICFVQSIKQTPRYQDSHHLHVSKFYRITQRLNRELTSSPRREQK